MANGSGVTISPVQQKHLDYINLPSWMATKTVLDPEEESAANVAPSANFRFAYRAFGRWRVLTMSQSGHITAALFVPHSVVTGAPFDMFLSICDWYGALIQTPDGSTGKFIQLASWDPPVPRFPPEPRLRIGHGHGGTMVSGLGIRDPHTFPHNGVGIIGDMPYAHHLMYLGTVRSPPDDPTLANGIALACVLDATELRADLPPRA